MILAYTEERMACIMHFAFQFIILEYTTTSLKSGYGEGVELNTEKSKICVMVLKHCYCNILSE